MRYDPSVVINERILDYVRRHSHPICYSKMIHFSIDLETLSVRIDAAIVAIGVQQFDIQTGELGAQFYREISFDSAMKCGHVSGSTLAWWVEQGTKARKLFGTTTEGKVGLATALDELSKFIRGVGLPAYVWGNGACNDIAWLEHAYIHGGVGLAQPWVFRNVRDLRTLVEAAQLRGFEWPEFEGTKHNALDDAKNQARAIIAAWEVLGGAKPKSKPKPPTKPAPADDDEF